jgi:hypothetical protein
VLVTEGQFCPKQNDFSVRRENLVSKSSPEVKWNNCFFLNLVLNELGPCKSKLKQEMCQWVGFQCIKITCEVCDALCRSLADRAPVKFPLPLSFNPLQ